MTTDMTKAKSKATDADVRTPQAPVAGHAAPHTRKTAADRRVTGYTRVKSGDIKRRSVSRRPDMSNPSARSVNPNVALGSLPSVVRPRQKVIPVASVRVEPTVRTITDTRKVSFPFSIVFLSLICSMLFLYMIFNYVQINEYTATVSDLKADIATLSVEADELNTKLERKNDLNLIEKIATEELGMVKIDEVTKKYISMDPGDVITPYDTKSAPIN